MNHFIEISKATSDDAIWITIHTGSRQFGLKICEYWQKEPARRQQVDKQKNFQSGLKEIKQKYKGKDIDKAIKELKNQLDINKVESSKLKYLTGKDMQGYLTDMIFTSIYAEENRKFIATVIKELLSVQSVDQIETVHNYINFQDFIIRKGAVSAHVDERLIIPFNMEDGILICKGKGNPDWNFSAPHGAGRIMSRSAAKKQFSAETAYDRMKDKGIYTSVVPVDEVKEAYKDTKIIEDAIGPTVDIIDRLIPIMNMKEG